MILGKVLTNVQVVQMLVLINVINGYGHIASELTIGWLHLLKKKVMMRM